MRILIYLGSKEYVRNYLSTAAFSFIEDHQLSYLAPPAVLAQIDQTRLQAERVISYPDSDLDSLRKQAFTLNNQLQMYDKRGRNPNFLFRLRRELIQNLYSLLVVPRKLYINPDNPILAGRPEGALKTRLLALSLASLKLLRNIWREIPGLFKYCLIALIVRARLKSLLSAALWRWIPGDEALTEILRAQRPDLLLIPSSIVESRTYELIRANSRLGYGKVALLIDNWDNLSSKSTFVMPPDFVGVMGRQSVAFATSIHEIPLDRVALLGTPRFEVYKEYFRRRAGGVPAEAKRPIEAPYILFAGCVAGFDEIGALKALSSALKILEKSFPPGTVILYRPHPWGARLRYLGILRSSPLDNVVIDPQMAEDSSTQGDSFQPALDYYPHLLAEALFVVCPLSTMVLESSIMRKQVLALAHEDDVSLFSPNRMLANYVHFEGLERLGNVTLVRSLEEELVRAMQAAQDRGDLPGLPESIDYFVDVTEPEYPEKLGRFINGIADALASGPDQISVGAAPRNLAVH